MRGLNIRRCGYVRRQHYSCAAHGACGQEDRSLLLIEIYNHLNSLTGYVSLVITGNSVYKSRGVGLVYSITTHIPSPVILHTCMDAIQLRRCFRSTRRSLINIHVYISYHIVALVE
jgi:hypothetical protein